MPKVTIIIVNYNTEDLIVDCIESIIKSKPKLEYEIIVIDNASTDGSLPLLKRMKDKFRIKLTENDRNVGFAKANNQGIRKAKGKHILLLNSDTQVEKDNLDLLYNFAKSNPDCAAVVPKLINSDGSGQGSVFKFPTVIRVMSQYWFGKDQNLDKYTPKGKKAIPVEVASMAAFLITPRARKKVGLLDERYFMYFEDFDYCRRVKMAGLKVYYLPNAKVVHCHGASGKNIAEPQLQWKRLIPSSKIYHGVLKHFLINAIIWSGEKINKL